MTILKNEWQIKNTDLIAVFNKSDEIFRIDNDGQVFWLKDGKLTKAKTDKDLGKAFAETIFNLNEKKDAQDK